MKLFNFILGVLGAMLIISTFSFLFPLVFLGGIISGSVFFAFGFPIFLMIIGTGMVYFGFFYNESRAKGNDELIKIGKWGIIYTLSVLISDFVINKLMIVNTFLATLFTAILISIVIQAVKSHEGYTFQGKWFIFYFLVYANIIWLMGEYILPQVAFQPGLLSSIVLGFFLAGVILLLRKININSGSIPWISLVLVLLLGVANLGSLQNLDLTDFSILPTNRPGLSEDRLACPSAIYNPAWEIKRLENDFDPNLMGLLVNSLINTSVWRIEGNVRSCYKGKYKNQYPDWFYCDDLIVSRWETSGSGTITYRWYTVVTSEWKPEQMAGYTQYILNGFSCENGKKVTVNKEKTEYYVYVSRDGTEIRINY